MCVIIASGGFCSRQHETWTEEQCPASVLFPPLLRKRRERESDTEYALFSCVYCGEGEFGAYHAYFTQDFENRRVDVGLHTCTRRCSLGEGGIK